MKDAEIRRMLEVRPTREETAESVERAYRKYSEDGRVLYNWAYILASTGDMDNALSVTDEALLLFLQSLRFHYLKADILYSTGRHQSWIRELESVLDFDRANTDVLMRLGEYYQKHFKEDLAKEYFLKALSYSPQDTDILSALASYDGFFSSIAEPLSENEYNSMWEKKAELPPPDMNHALKVFASGRKKNYFIPMRNPDPFGLRDGKMVKSTLPPFSFEERLTLLELLPLADC